MTGGLLAFEPMPFPAGGGSCAGAEGQSDSTNRRAAAVVPARPLHWGRNMDGTHVENARSCVGVSFRLEGAPGPARSSALGEAPASIREGSVGSLDRS